MSGNASRGIWRRAQIPVSTSRTVPMKTRKRFRAHQSIHREITLHASRGIHAQLLGRDAMPIAGIAGMKNVTLTSAPEIGAPLASVSFTRNTLLPFRGVVGSELNSTIPCGALVVDAAPAPGGGGTNEPSAA